jgi:transposase
VARLGRPVAELVLTDEEHDTLQRWARRAKSSQALAQRCRIVLGCAAGKSNKEVAAEVGVWPQTVGIWRQRFIERRLEGLADEPRPGAPRSITDEQVEEVLVATLERQARDATHWSRASMAAETGLSKSTVGRIWKAFGLKPHWSTRSKSAMIHSSSTRCATSSGCTWIPPRRRGCSASMKNP